MTVGDPEYLTTAVIATATDNIPTDFYFLLETDLLVESDGRGTLTLDVDYTVNLPLEVGGFGSIDMIDAVVTETIKIINNPPCTQLINFLNTDRFPADLNEKGLDKLTMLVCRIRGDLDDRYWQFPISEAGNGVSNVSPSQSDRMAGGNGTLCAFSGVDGGLDAVSKGLLGTSLTLSNDSSMGGGTPDPVNGSTQAAAKTYIDTGDAAVTAALQPQITANANAIAANAADITTINNTIAAGGGGLLSNAQLFTGSGTFNVPADVTTVRVIVAAGGGGGGGSSGNVGAPYTQGGGGTSGGAGEVRVGVLTVTPSTSIPVTVGAGGAGGAGNAGGLGSVGSAGGSSTFDTITSNGGGGGNVGNSGTAGAGGAGGAGGQYAINGSGGSSANIIGAVEKISGVPGGVSGFLPYGKGGDGGAGGSTFGWGAAGVTGNDGAVLITW